MGEEGAWRGGGTGEGEGGGKRGMHAIKEVLR